MYASIQLSSPEHINQALNNIERQEHDSRWIIVEGPEVRGVWARMSRPDDIVLACDVRSPAAARNVALGYLRATGAERTPEGYRVPRLAWLDEDDWYGPRYLAEVATALEAADAVRRSTVHVQLSDGGRVVLRDGPGRELRLGGTLACRVCEAVPNFDANGRTYTEDGRWVLDCHRAGLRVATIDSDQYLWIRYGDSAASGVTDAVIRRLVYRTQASA